LIEGNRCRMCVFSFDFREGRHVSRTRKTQFFRRLYGYTQRLTRRKKDGQVISYSYHYPGILDQLPHVKLGKSVFGVVPNSKDQVLDLLHAFPEVTFHQFISWLPVDSCPSEVGIRIIRTSSLIERFGFLAFLLMAYQQGGSLPRSFLHEVGLEDEYIDAAAHFLSSRGLARFSGENLEVTSKGEILARVLIADDRESK